MNSIYNPLLFFLVFTSNHLFAQGLVFEKGQWAEVVARATKENKPIFVDAYTTWCGPCKWMAKNTFTDEKVGAFYTENYVAYKMDMEKGEGPSFANQHKVNAYPTLLYFSPKGQLLHKVVGGMGVDDFLKVSKEALDPAKQLYTLMKKYEDGQRDNDLVVNYLLAMSQSGSDISQPFKDYWSGLADIEKQTEQCLMMMANASGYFSDITGPYFGYFMDNKAAYQNVAGKEQVTGLLDYAYRQSVFKYISTEDKKAQNELKKVIVNYYPAKKKEFPKQALYYQLMKENPTSAKAKKARSNYFKITNNAEELNSAAWEVYSNEEDPNVIREALEWSDRAIELSPNYYNYDTKAALLYKLKAYESAKKIAELAIKIAEKEGNNNTEETLKLLEDINRKLK